MSEAVFLEAEWRHLAVLNWRVERALLAPLVPAGVELDLWGGTAHVSALGFLFQGTRVLGVPVPFHGKFEEINVRFYVRREAAGEVRRGIVFVKEIVPKTLVTLGARLLYNEKYATASMSHAVGAGHAAFQVRRGSAVATVRAEAPPELRPLAPKSEEERHLEQHFGYVRRPDGGTMEYQVDHPRWRVSTATRAAIEGDAGAFYGPAFGEVLKRPPDSALLAEGSAVAVRRPVKIA